MACAGLPLLSPQGTASSLKVASYRGMEAGRGMGSREGVEGTGVGFWERFELMVVMLFSTRFPCPVNRGNLN